MPKELGPPRRGMGTKRSGEARRRFIENEKLLPWILIGLALIATGFIAWGAWGAKIEASHSATATTQAIRLTQNFMDMCNSISQLNYLNLHPVPTPFDCP